jgi:hypothetical protein
MELLEFAATGKVFLKQPPKVNHKIALSLVLVYLAVEQKVI